MRPPSDATTPLIRLISVLFPAPFGPMSPLIWPRPIAKEAPSMAQTPPKLRATFSTRRTEAWSADLTPIDGNRGAAGKRRQSCGPLFRPAARSLGLRIPPQSTENQVQPANLVSYDVALGA